MLEVNDFDAIRIGLASPDQIRSWSYGEVTKPETINYRTLRPEKDGLFCERIFGPSKDWECSCGKYKRVRFKGIVCDKCGVEVARSKVRRERMGHIDLAAPVSHIWYFKGTPSRIGLLLDLSPRNLERILYYATFIVTGVNEDARQRALSGIEESVQIQLQQRETHLTEQVRGIQQQRDERTTELQSSVEERVAQAKAAAEAGGTDRKDEIKAVTAAEKALDKSLKKQLGQVTTDEIVFTPSGELIAQRGDVIEQRHLDKVKDIAGQMRGMLEASAAGTLTDADLDRQTRDEVDRMVLRAQLDAEAAIADRNDDLQAFERNLREQTDLRRRRLEDLAPGKMLTDQEHREMRDFERELRMHDQDMPDLFQAGMGAESVKRLLEAIDLDELALKMRHEIATTGGQRRKKATKRLNVTEAFRKSGNRPEWMILTVLPVLPPELRPMVQLDGGRFATSDLNDLYRRVINRNNRLKKLLEIGAPEIIVRNEKRMLQEACDALIDNGRRGRAVSGSGNHKLKSLSDMLKGKQGRFRQNLLGKRVDYSGRSVIVVGPDLKLHQCGLPKKMALELFKPFVMRKLVEHGHAHNIKSAKRFVERVRPEVWDALEEVIHSHPVLLNRAPTLHRLGIQAFEAVLIEGSAIQLHPLVCSAFNADFDGDQMAVHVPLSERAQEEARSLMLSSFNILSPANGDPSIGASQEMVLGSYYLTLERPGQMGEGHIFTTPREAQIAYDQGFIALQARIKVRVGTAKLYNAPGKSEEISPNTIVETTVGRLIFNDVLPESLRFKNYSMDKGNLRGVIAECFKFIGRAATADLADQIKRLGFAYATRAGVSIGISDVPVPEERDTILAEADGIIGQIDDDFRMGLMSDDERYKRSVAIWMEATDEMQKKVQTTLDPYGVVYTIANSGATKAKFQQIRQLSGMRGLMADPSGRIMEIPVRGNFRDGLNVMEYFISSHGARKGLADTALRTAESGYLTRRLIDVAQDVNIMYEDCGTPEGIWITEHDSLEMNAPFRSRVVGRTLAHVVPGFEHITVGSELDEDTVDAMLAAGVKEIYCRSVLQCRVSYGVCALCYGRNLATGRPVVKGEAVGIVAAQSIGEPGTQLTMRTFHTGGIAGATDDITQGLPRVEELFEARTPKDKAVVTEIAGNVEIIEEETGARKIRVTDNQIIDDEYPLPKGSRLGVQDGQIVKEGDVVAKQPAASGSGMEDVLARTGGVVVSPKRGSLAIRLEVRDEREYVIPAALAITVRGGERVEAGQALTGGQIDPQDVLRIKGREAVHLYLVREVQKVYRSTGVYINDKHIEIIVRQMLRRVRIEDSGDTEMLPNELVDRFLYEELNTRTLAEGGEPATAQTVLLGVTKSSLNTASFLAAASFQETTRVLTEAAIKGDTDHLRGLKENVIIGKLIPAGTGLELRAELREKQRQQRALLGGFEMPVGMGGESYEGNGYETTTDLLAREDESVGGLTFDGDFPPLDIDSGSKE
ncbi:MAG TPA: DNA-directed RNA polymerase subunit beta' [Ktedonobacterales bacterium]